MEAGRDAMRAFVRRQDQAFKRNASEEVLARVAEEMKYADTESLYVAVGEGTSRPSRSSHGCRVWSRGPPRRT